MTKLTRINLGKVEENVARKRIFEIEDEMINTMVVDPFGYGEKEESALESKLDKLYALLEVGEEFLSLR